MHFRLLRCLCILNADCYKQTAALKNTICLNFVLFAISDLKRFYGFPEAWRWAAPGANLLRPWLQIKWHKMHFGSQQVASAIASLEQPSQMNGLFFDRLGRVRCSAVYTSLLNDRARISLHETCHVYFVCRLVFMPVFSGRPFVAERSRN